MGLSEGTETKMTIQDERFSVTEILVRIAGAVSSMQMTVQDIQTRPSQLPEVADKAFKYFKIDKTAQDSAIGSAVIKFRVEKKWLSENGLDKSTVALERYVTKWVKLATKLLSEDDDFVYYEAESPGFSYFAVTAKVPGTVTEPVPEVIVPSVEPPTPEVKEEAPPAAEEKVPQKPKEDKPNVLLLVLVAVLIIIAGYLLYKKPKAHEHDLDKIAKELDDLKKKKH
jgi:PGF-pre-PGF domain-containing protein